MTVYLAWYSYWDSDKDELLGVFRTHEAAHTALCELVDKNVMAKWILDEPVQE